MYGEEASQIRFALFSYHALSRFKGQAEQSTEQKILVETLMPKEAGPKYAIHLLLHTFDDRSVWTCHAGIACNILDKALQTRKQSRVRSTDRPFRSSFKQNATIERRKIAEQSTEQKILVETLIANPLEQSMGETLIANPLEQSMGETLSILQSAQHRPQSIL